jgi:YD repeat-containing protein
VTAITDPLSHQTLLTYSPQGQPVTVTTPAGTTTFSYDGGDLVSITDPLGRTTTRFVDGLGRLRRVTVTGQPAVSYGYDNANWLTSITQSSATVGFAYDDADRRTVLTLPNGVTVEYGYDDASQVTSLTYKAGSTTLGTLTYTYDLAGNRTSVGGTWARTGLPAALASATYDAVNPSGDDPSWEPPQNKPMSEPRVPFIPLPTQVPTVPEIPIRIPIPVFP